MTYDFGLRLRQLRVQKRLSQTQVAKRLGLTRTSISGYENNIAQPSQDTLVRLALLYGTTTDYILGLDHRKFISLDGLTESQQNMMLKLFQDIVFKICNLNRQMDYFNP